jgi:hypothetical protein
VFTIHVSRRAVVVLILGGLLTVPGVSWASHRFVDVPDENIFHEDIAWLADAGVTRGCNPPVNDEFCPDNTVTRAQMAAFLRRFAQYLDAEDGTPGYADTAGDADTLDGQDASGFLGASDKAVDADRLDGLNSTAFLRESERTTAAYDGGNSAVRLTDVPKIVASVTVDQATSGRVILNSSATVFADLTQAEVECSITTSTSTVDSNYRQEATTLTDDKSTIAGTRGYTINKGVLVSPDKQVYNLVCRDVNDNPTLLLDGNLSAVFVPDPAVFRKLLP